MDRPTRNRCELRAASMHIASNHEARIAAPAPVIPGGFAITATTTESEQQPHQHLGLLCQRITAAAGAKNPLMYFLP